MEKPWTNNEKNMEQPWKNMENTWNNHGKTMKKHGTTMEKHGKHMDNYGKIDGTTMETPWKNPMVSCQGLWLIPEIIPWKQHLLWVTCACFNGLVQRRIYSGNLTWVKKNTNDRWFPVAFPINQSHECNVSYTWIDWQVGGWLCRSRFLRLGRWWCHRGLSHPRKGQQKAICHLLGFLYHMLSDIHGYTIRYRIEGALTMSETMPCNWWKIFCGKATRRTHQGNWHQNLSVLLEDVLEIYDLLQQTNLSKVGTCERLHCVSQWRCILAKNLGS